MCWFLVVGQVCDCAADLMMDILALMRSMQVPKSKISTDSWPLSKRKSKITNWKLTRCAAIKRNEWCLRSTFIGRNSHSTRRGDRQWWVHHHHHYQSSSASPSYDIITINNPVYHHYQHHTPISITNHPTPSIHQSSHSSFPSTFHHHPSLITFLITIGPSTNHLQHHHSSFHHHPSSGGGCVWCPEELECVQATWRQTHAVLQAVRCIVFRAQGVCVLRSSAIYRSSITVIAYQHLIIHWTVPSLTPITTTITILALSSAINTQLSLVQFHHHHFSSPITNHHCGHHQPPTLISPSPPLTIFCRDTTTTTKPWCTGCAPSSPYIRLSTKNATVKRQMTMLTMEHTTTMMHQITCWFRCARS